MLSSLLKKSQADVLIAEAGALDLSLVAEGNKQLSQVIWVAKIGSRHMDWNDVPAELTNSLEVSVWHELVDEKRDLAGLELPEWDPTTKTPSVSTVWRSSAGDGELVEYQPEVGQPRTLRRANANHGDRTWFLVPRACCMRFLATNVSARVTWSSRSTLCLGRTLFARSSLLCTPMPQWH